MYRKLEKEMYRKTIKKSINFKGKGIHSGKQSLITLMPAQENAGILFMNKNNILSVSSDNILNTKGAITLGTNKFSVRTVEHLLAALMIAEISDLIINIEGDEIPFLDGSSKIFYDEILKAGILQLESEIKPIKIINPIYIVEKNKYLIVLPSDCFEIISSLDGNHAILEAQTFYMKFENKKWIAEEILPARTFGFLKDINKLHKAGFALGADKKNTLILTTGGCVLNNLLFKNEPIRHKILDLIGDFYILGRPIQAKVISHNTNHKIHIELVKKIYKYYGNSKNINYRVKNANNLY